MKSSPIEKSLSGDGISDRQLDALNQYTRRALTKDEVFVFSVILCDNEIDRDLEQFPKASLEKLAALYKGRTGVFDHRPQAEHQNARIFETELVEPVGTNSLGQPGCQLKAWAYMARSAKNADLILEIDAGIKKEVSVGCAVERIACSVCGADQKLEGCTHKKGEDYGGKPCFHLLLDPTDAYEWSFVAVPAQKNAGVTKGYGKQGVLAAGDCTLEKLFGQPGDTVVTKAQLDALSREHASLKALASAGEEYCRGLRKEAVRAVLLTQPDLDPAMMEQVAGQMDLPQLREFVRTFSRAAAKSLPPLVQLAPEGGEEGADTRFVI